MSGLTPLPERMKGRSETCPTTRFLGVALAALSLIPGPMNAQAPLRSRHPLTRPEFDAGRVAGDKPIERMVLVLQADAVQEQRLQELLAAQHDPNSPQYHQWLSPEEFGRQFGVSEGDLSQVVRWLEDHGFEVEPVAEGRRQIVFSGTASQVATAFKTEIHEYRINGVAHHANATDLEIPTALAPAVAGMVSLHDFYAKPMHSRLRPVGGKTAGATEQPMPEFTGSGGVHYTAPGDFAMIYNLGSLYGSSTNGSGQSIAIVARSNLKLADIETFRTNFGLDSNDPIVIVNGSDPGVLSSDEQGEVELDTEWSGAIAPKASIQVVVSASSASTDGVTLSAQYIVNKNVAPIVSVSFGTCESAMSRAENQFWNSLWQQAAAQGMSVFVASGDSGAAGCDAPSATMGTTADVNGICSSPYATCVGGTQFNDTNNPALYWYSSNTSGHTSALGYIPEVAWNESGSSGLWSSGGGPSSVYAKPSWQTGPGVPADGHRDVPDVSLASADHDGYLFYLNGSLYAGSGTSVAAPSFAGLMALIDGRQGARQGNPNPLLYALAASQAHGGPAVFHDIKDGDNSVPGVPGYSAGAAYDLVTGLGSVDANLLVNAWNNGGPPPPPKCTYALDSASASVDATAQNLVVTLTASAASCSWSATSDSDWLVITSGGSGGGSQAITYSITANPSSIARTGILTIAGLAYPVTQAGAPCTYTISVARVRMNSNGFNGSVTVSSPGGCAWTATSQEPWMRITGGTPGSGNGIVSFTTAANIRGTRTGTLTVAGSFVTVTQGPRSKLGLAPPPVH